MPVGSFLAKENNSPLNGPFNGESRENGTHVCGVANAGAGAWGVAWFPKDPGGEGAAINQYKSHSSRGTPHFAPVVAHSASLLPRASTSSLLPPSSFCFAAA
jgi:hypothetical protein